MRSYIYYSTILGVFSGALIYRAAFDIRFSYLIILSNLFLILVTSHFWRIPRWIGIMMLYLFLSGLAGLIRGTDTLAQFSKEWLGISCNALFYYYFFRLYRNDYMRAFTTYARVSYFVCLLGFPILALDRFRIGQEARLHSIALEPAAFCELILPAYFWYASMFVAGRRYRKELAVFSLAIALAVSSLGYLSVAFGICLLPFKRKTWLLATPLVAGGLLGIIYYTSTSFKLRLDDTVRAVTISDVSESNLSTFALVSNMLVAQKVFEESPWIGNGLGSHVISYKRFIADVPGLETMPEDWNGSNSTEAGSLTLRLLSEQGLLGLSLVLWFIVKFHASWIGKCGIISNALLTCFFLKLIRSGIYFGPEQFFFVFIYLLNYRNYKRENRERSRITFGKMSGHAKLLSGSRG